MRLFLGLEIPGDIQERIASYLKPLQKSEKGWEKPHDYHQTLLFIGEASDEELADIKSRMNQITFSPFTLNTDIFQFFNRRILYLSFKKSPELLKLQDEVESLYSEWLRPGSKPFIPHVTVKRWQRYEYDDLKQGLDAQRLPEMSFEVRSLSLFKSEKDADNNKYHVIHQRYFT